MKILIKLMAAGSIAVISQSGFGQAPSPATKGVVRILGTGQQPCVRTAGQGHPPGRDQCLVYVRVTPPTATAKCNASIGFDELFVVDNPSSGPHIPMRDRRPRDITWEISKTLGDMGGYFFDPVDGIKVDPATDPRPPQVKVRPVPHSTNQFFGIYFNNRPAKLGVNPITYLPKVWRSESQTGTPTECTSVDPKITNDAP